MGNCIVAEINLGPAKHRSFLQTPPTIHVVQNKQTTTMAEPSSAYEKFLMTLVLCHACLRYTNIMLSIEKRISSLPWAIATIVHIIVVALYVTSVVYYFIGAHLGFIAPIENQARWRINAARLLFCADIMVSIRLGYFSQSQSMGIFLAYFLNFAVPTAYLLLGCPIPPRVANAEVDDPLENVREINRIRIENSCYLNLNC